MSLLQVLAALIFQNFQSAASWREKTIQMNNPNIRGIIAMCFAMAFFVMNDIFVKLAGASWPVHQIMAIRGAMASALVLGYIFYLGQQGQLKELLHPLVILRGLCESIVAFTFITALVSMPLADVTAILMISPLLITIAGAFFLGEDVRWRRWLAVAVGFVGMLLVVRPSGADFTFATVMAIISACGVAVRDLITRAVPSSVPSLIVTLCSTIAVMLAGMTISVFNPLVAYNAIAFCYCIGAALTVALGNYAMVIAFRNVEVSVVAPYRYTLIIWAVLGGYLVFGNNPAAIAWLGIILIIISGIYTMNREKRAKNR
jgi:drug/metabolite transporter (DMT)-like permease